MSHHYSGPNFGFPHGDARLDFTDLYAFPKPGDAGKSIFIVNVHPAAGFRPPGPTISMPFATNARYELLIDTDGDNDADITYSVSFAGTTNGGQAATVRRNGNVICENAPVSLQHEAVLANAGGYRLFAGWRSDPFFFDTVGAVNNLQFTGTDFFLDKNVCSIVLEVPNAELGSGKLGLWVRTVDGSSGTWKQADRGAKPSQTPFLSGDQNAAYLGAQPSDDAQFVALFAHGLEHAGGYGPQEATLAAMTLLPDIMRYDVGLPAAYPANGRALTDDASGHFLAVLTNGKLTSVGLPAHADLLAEFPYVGPPHAGLHR